MTWSQQNGGNVSSILRSEYEQLLTPNRGATFTANAVKFPSNEAQQGRVKTQNDKPAIAGVDPAAISFARWW